MLRPLYCLTLCLAFSWAGVDCEAEKPKKRKAAKIQDAAGYVVVDLIGEQDRPVTVSGTFTNLFPQGFGVTNRHVSPGNNGTARSTEITFHAGQRNEFSVAGEVISVHPDRDLTLIKVENKKKMPRFDLGSSAELELTAPVKCIGFPFGPKVAEDGQNPSVTVTTGAISALREDSDGRLMWIDFTAPIAGGSSGGALLDKNDKLIGIVTQQYGKFGRATPVEYVKELVGEEALKVEFDPPIAPRGGGKVKVTITPREPASAFQCGTLRITLMPNDERFETARQPSLRSWPPTTVSFRAGRLSQQGPLQALSSEVETPLAFRRHSNSLKLHRPLRIVVDANSLR